MNKSCPSFLLLLAVYLVETEGTGTTRMVGRGKVHEGNPKSEKSPLDEAKADIIDKLKSTIEELEQAISESAKMTKENFAEWIESLENIIEGGNETKDGTDDKKEEHGEDYLSWGRFLQGR